ncbi:head-tail adaptor protein [Palleronia sediminis]|nr:head-tail adaptor protein [Palleronia sediminis]
MGGLSRRLVLEMRVRVPDGAGGFAEDWAGLGILWAAMRPGSARRVGADEMSLSRVGWRITVRGAPVGSPARPVAGQRFREGGRVFAIRAVREADAAGEHLTCFAEEETAQ